MKKQPPKEPGSLEDWVKEGSLWFKNQEQAVPILITGLVKVLEINERLRSLVENDSELQRIKDLTKKQALGELKEDHIKKHLVKAYKERSQSNIQVRKDLRHIVSYFKDFSAEEQLRYAELIFEGMPQTDASTIAEFQKSMYGTFQIPRVYMRRLSLSCSYSIKQHAKFNKPWNPHSFETIYNETIRIETSLTRSHEYNGSLKMITVSNAFGMGKKR